MAKTKSTKYTKYIVRFCSLLVGASALGAIGWGGKSSPVVTFMPENNLHLEAGLYNTDMTEERFNEIVDEAYDFYAPVISDMGANLRINADWPSTTVNASASRSGSTWIVNMYGGLARRPEVTDDGFAMVLCHEIGHHVGGFPKVGGWGNPWAANEGQSDYFATITCARELWMAEWETNATYRDSADDNVKLLCDANWTDNRDQDLCYRVLMAGFSLAELLGGAGTVSYDTPDPSVVSQTESSHPEAQCRLDTYGAGGLCGKHWEVGVVPNSETASALQVCVRASGAQVGTRPLCWYKPTLECDSTFDSYCDGETLVSCSGGDIVREDCAGQGQLCLYSDVEGGYACVDGEDPCQGETAEGRCDGNTVIRCEDGQVTSEDCEAQDLQCGYDSSAGGYGCIEAEDPCDGETAEGRCDGDTVIWCQDDTVQSEDCAASGQECGFDDEAGVYACIGGSDSCNGETPEGRCDGNTVTWCEDGQVRSQDCWWFMHCGYRESMERNACLWWWE